MTATSCGSGSRRCAWKESPSGSARSLTYIGRYTEIGRALLDPRLDPNIDDARNYMVQILWYAQGLQGYASHDTGQQVYIDAERTDFKGVPYFTDGHPGRPLAVGAADFSAGNLQAVVG